MALRESHKADYASLFLKEVRFSAIKSRGPGGQNVNKVSSAIELRWEPSLSEKLNEDQKMLVTEKLAHHINKLGELVLKSDRFRDQERNKSDCIAKLNNLLEKAFYVPKLRKKTKPTKASRKKRVDTKKQRGEIKRTRSKLRL